MAVWLVLIGLWAVGSVPVGAEDLLAEARLRYNAARYDEAIELATAVMNDTGSAAAAVVAARARLERFRARGDRHDLDAAHRLLRRIDPTALSTRERNEWELGVAASLYLHAEYGPAAEILDRLLRDGSLSDTDRDRLVDWWASAVDQGGHHLDRAQRAHLYERLAQRLESELGRHPASSAAAYWLVEAVRGAGDLERAWNLTVAHWVRAGPGNQSLRADLDRLMLQGVIPDLAVSRTDLPAEDPRTVGAMATLAREWEAIKAVWTPQ